MGVGEMGVVTLRSSCSHWSYWVVRETACGAGMGTGAGAGTERAGESVWGPRMSLLQYS